jgi:bacterial/archaeal transporter family-2 protein
MSAGFALALVGMVVAGAGIATQAPMNARLAVALGDTVTAAMVSFAVGLAVLAPLVVLGGGLPASAGIASAPWWAWLGGVLGAFYVWAAVVSVPVLGVLTTMAALILGQMIGALVLDAVGAFGVPVNALSWRRLLAVFLVGAGVLLSRF